MLPSNPPGGCTRAQILLLHRLLTCTRLASGKGNGTFPLSLSFKCLPSRLEVGLSHLCCITSLGGGTLVACEHFSDRAHLQGGGTSELGTHLWGGDIST